jgi:hypothetical protein
LQPRNGPPLLAKLDLADGYYRVPITATAALHLAVLLPDDGPYGPLIALPLSLPMGWAQSPPFFCAYTETVTDIAKSTNPATPHPLLPATQSPAPDISIEAHTSFHPTAVTLPTVTTKPLVYTDIYIDDFITITQCPVRLPAFNSVLKAITSVFTDPDGSPRRAIVSTSKLDK